tara:strand:- start:5117 stop:5686 length:570 start_codon:yes stop_codon:yes gene_type:complete
MKTVMGMETPSFEMLVKDIKLQKGVHDIFEDSYRRLIVFQKSLNTIFSAFITLIVFADFGLIEWIDSSWSGIPVMLTVGIISFVLFVMNALYEVFQVSNSFNEHARAIQLYSDLLLDLELAKQKTDSLENYRKRYMDVARLSVKVGRRRFEKARQLYIRNRMIREQLKKNPFIRKNKIIKNLLEGLDND